MNWLIAIQRRLYRGVAEGMRTATDIITALPAIVTLALLFGIEHALNAHWASRPPPEVSGAKLIGDPIDCGL